MRECDFFEAGGGDRIDDVALITGAGAETRWSDLLNMLIAKI